MRTTVRLDDDLLARAKAHAARSGTSLTKVIEDALRVLLERTETPRQTRPFKMVTFKGDGLQPGVDLDDSAALLDRMEGVE
jgi:Arc/MetJ family transcription regulator